MSDIIVPGGLSPSQDIKKGIGEFFRDFEVYEIISGSKLVLNYDLKSNAYYLTCHLKGKQILENCDLEATLDPEDEEDEIYKLNREITEDQLAYKEMENDALHGRSFEDLVVEYDKSYRADRPLKVYGGQHRIKAISKSKDMLNAITHGVRIYFNLSRDQKVEIATVNNTSIAVPNDLLDRMREHLLGTELRDWSQKVGILEKGEDFSDRRSPTVPTVRIIRTLLVNYHLGLNAEIEDFHQPILCKSGGVDDDYINLRPSINWDDPQLNEMGEKFALLHRIQHETVIARNKDKLAEFARKALSLSVVSSWAYASGLFQKHPEYLKDHYALPDVVNPPEDPLNAKALSQARLKGIDPETYRGLGTRSGARELGRMLEVFIVLTTKSTKKRITRDLANASIQSYEAKKARYEADQALGNI